MPVLPANAVPPIPGRAEQLEDLADALGLADVMSGDDEDVAGLRLRSGVSWLRRHMRIALLSGAGRSGSPVPLRSRRQLPSPTHRAPSRAVAYPVMLAPPACGGIGRNYGTVLGRLGFAAPRDGGGYLSWGEDSVEIGFPPD